MDRAQTRLLVALAVLLTIVALFLYLQGPQTAPADPSATATVWDLGEDAELSAIGLERPGDTVRLAASDDGWHIVSPEPPGRADEDRASALARALLSLRRAVPVDAPPDRAADFGLGDPPAVRVTVETTSGVTAHLDVGNEAPVGYRTYVRGADGAIVAASGDLHRLVTAEAPTFRDHQVFHFRPDEVQDVSIASTGSTVALTREGGFWWVDGLGPGDPATVDDLVGSLLDLRFDTIRATTGGVPDPVVAIEVVLANGSRQSLRTGVPVDDEVEGTAGDGRTGPLYEGILRELGRSATDLAWRRAFGIALETADEVVVATERRTVRAVRNGPAWTIDGMEDGTAYDAVAALAAVPVLGWIDDQDTVLAEPEATVTVRAGADTWRVDVGGEVGPGEVAVRYGRGRPARIPSDGVRKFLDAVPRG